MIQLMAEIQKGRFMKRIVKIVIVLIISFFPASCYAYIIANQINGRLMPEIKYGEFPFHFEYKLDGEIFSIKDTVKIEFGGHGLGRFGFPYRRWRKTVLSGENPSRRDIFHDTDVPSVFTAEQHNMAIWIFLGTGWPAYYMGDTTSWRRPPSIRISEEVSLGRGSLITTTDITADQLQEYFGITILTWEFSEPVRNRLRWHRDFFSLF
jgi:hypothetical protein